MRSSVDQTASSEVDQHSVRTVRLERQIWGTGERRLPAVKSPVSKEEEKLVARSVKCGLTKLRLISSKQGSGSENWDNPTGR